jgi:hypothetical protein
MTKQKMQKNLAIKAFLWYYNSVRRGWLVPLKPTGWDARAADSEAIKRKGEKNYVYWVFW